MNKEMLELGKTRSIIRELFEFSKQRKKEIGDENVFDFSLGNPSVKPNPKINEEIKNIIDNNDDTYTHGYTSAQGDFECRVQIAKDLNNRYSTNYTADNIYMTCGAAASLSITMRAIIETDNDEIIAIAPYFTEYKVFAEGVGFNFKVADADLETFNINFDSLLKV